MFRTFFTATAWAMLLSISSVIPRGDGQDDAKKVERAKGVIAEIQSCKNLNQVDAWAPLLNELVDLGPSATLPVCDALRTTDSGLHLRLFGFALRALNDSRAVPTLIETIPRTLVPPCSDMGMRFEDEAVLKFLQEHDLDKENREGLFAVGRPCREIIGALEKITGHQFDDADVIDIQLFGGPLHKHLQKKAYHELAVKWKTWWLQHYREAGADMDFVQVNLEPFSGERPKAVNAFADKSAKIGMRYMGLVLTPAELDRSASHFLDLDTGRISSIEKNFPGDLNDAKEVRRWAGEQGFDLMALQVELPGFDKPQFVIKPLGLKFWQDEEDRYDFLENEIGDKDFEFGKPGGQYLAYYDAKSERYLPNRKATFLYQTREGTCGAIRLIAQVTEILDLSGPPISIGDIPENQDIHRGVKFEMKSVYRSREK